MIAFIDQEASEKAEEIDSKAEEEYQIEKGRLMQEQRAGVSQVYEKKKSQNELLRKVRSSQLQNEARLRVLQDREDYMTNLTSQALQALSALTKDHTQYSQLLEGLITQGMLQLMEDTVVIRCREADSTLVESVLPRCTANYKQLSQRSINMTIDKNNWLRPDLTGGVEVMTSDAKIKAVNTLESRLEMINKQMMPQLRDILFGPNKNRKFHD